MKTMRKLLWITLAMLVFASCKKEGPVGPEGPQGPQGPTGYTTDVNPYLYGKWDVVSGLPGTRHIILKNNNVLFRLDTADYGFCTMLSDLAMVTYAQIDVFMSLYNYTIAGSNLTLANQNDTIILSKNDAAPSETEWVTWAGITDSIPNPEPDGDGREDIGFDGTNILWLGESNTSKLYKINPSTHVSTTVNLSGSYYYGGVNYTNPDLWISNSNKINKVNSTSGATISTSPTLSSGLITGFAQVGQTIYYCADDHLKTWNVVTDVIQQFYSLTAHGMEYVNGFLYISNGRHVHKCQVGPVQCIQTFYVGESWIGSTGGITYDGSNFWMAGSKSWDEYYLIKLDM